MENARRWLNRRGEIDTHLEALPQKLTGVLVEYRGQQIWGHFLTPPDGSDLLFRVHGSLLGLVEPPPEGAIIRMRYETPRETYSFLSKVTAVSRAGIWSISPPNTIGTQDKRKAPRQLAGKRCWFSIEPRGTRVRVFDLSKGGLAVIYDSPLLALRSGQNIHGVLEVDEDLFIPMALKVRHNRPSPGKQTISGMELMDIGMRDADALTERLSHW